jgi:flagellar hook-length control protein FliK
MPSDSIILQQITQRFSSGPSCSFFSRPVCSKSPENLIGFVDSAMSESDFEKILRKTSLEFCTSKESNFVGGRQACVGEKNEQNHDKHEIANILTYGQNFAGEPDMSQLQTPVVTREPCLGGKRIYLLQLLKEIGSGFMAPAESTGTPNPSALGVDSALNHVDDGEKDLIRAVRQMYLALPESILKQFGEGTGIATDDQLQRLIDVVNGISSDRPGLKLKSGFFENTFQITPAKAGAAQTIGDVNPSHASTDMFAILNSGPATKSQTPSNLALMTPLLDFFSVKAVFGNPNMQADVEEKNFGNQIASRVAAGGADNTNPTNLSEMKSLLVALADLLKPDIQNMQGGARDNLFGNRNVSKNGFVGSNLAISIDLQNQTKLSSGQEHSNVSRMPLNDFLGGAQLNAGEAVSNNLTAAKVLNESLVGKPTVLPTEAVLSDLGSKIANADTVKDEGFSFGQYQKDLKNSESHTLVKETDTVPKEIRTQALDQIVQKAVMQFKNGRNEIQLNLKPEFLGNLRMQVITESHQVTVRILAEFPMVKDLIENNLQQLKSDLQSYGLEIDELEVSVGHGLDQHVADQQKTNARHGGDATDNRHGDEEAKSEPVMISHSGTSTADDSSTIDFFA